MAILYLEDALLREPNLWVPGKKPVGAVKIDWEHPLSRGLTGVLLASYGMKNLVDNGTITFLPSFEGLGTSQYGQHLTFLNSYADLPSSIRDKIIDTGMMSIFARQRLTNTISADQRIASCWGGGGDAQFILWNDAGGGGDGYAFIINNGGARVGESVASSVLNKWQNVCGTYDKVNLKIYVEGKEKASTAYTTSLFASSAEYGLARINSTVNAYDGDMACVFFWDRGLSAPEVSSLEADPYQILMPA